MQQTTSKIPPSTSAVPALRHIFVATFAVKQTDGKVKTEVVEVPHTQDPKADTAAAWAIVRERHPTVPRDNIRRTGGVIESRRAGELPVIPIRPGDTIRQLFPDGSEFEAARTVGTVIFDGARRDVVLRHIRAKSVWSLTLAQSGSVAINFSEQITVMRLASELPKMIADMLGTEATELNLYLKVIHSGLK